VDAGRLLGRGIGFPPRIGPDGRVMWSEGEVNVRESVRIILLTEERERIRLPEFGGSLTQFLFEPNTVTTRQLIRDRIGKALEQWEPRIRVETITVEPDQPPPGSREPGDPQSAVATVTYKLVATQVRERVSLNVTLAR
jgi:phage baseplate assembly protein W